MLCLARGAHPELLSQSEARNVGADSYVLSEYLTVTQSKAKPVLAKNASHTANEALKHQKKIYISGLQLQFLCQCWAIPRVLRLL